MATTHERRDSRHAVVGIRQQPLAAYDPDTMPCFPQFAHNERLVTDAFVAFLNGLEGTSFVYRASPEREDRNSPRPESLYEDEDTGAQLVVECKNIVWPLDWAARHANDHLVASVLQGRLAKAANDRPMTLELKPAGRMTRPELLS